MAFCTKCGAQNAEGVGFCTTCGNPLAAAPVAAPPAAPQYAPPAAPPQYAPPGAPVMYQAAPMAPAQPNMVVTMFNSLDLGEKIAGVGGLVAAIAFFLPWSGGSAYSASMNGMDATKYAAVYWLALLLPLVAVGLLYFAYNNDLRTKIIVAAAHCAIGAFTVFELLSPGVMSNAQFGAWAMQGGFLAIAVGGFMSIFNLSNRLRGVR